MRFPARVAQQASRSKGRSPVIEDLIFERAAALRVFQQGLDFADRVMLDALRHTIDQCRGEVGVHIVIHGDIQSTRPASSTSCKLAWASHGAPHLGGVVGNLHRDVRIPPMRIASATASRIVSLSPRICEV